MDVNRLNYTTNEFQEILDIIYECHTLVHAQENTPNKEGRRPNPIYSIAAHDRLLSVGGKLDLDNG